MRRGPSRVSFEDWVLVGLLALVPVVFSRVTAECFEIPQTVLLTTGGLLLVWWRLAGSLDSMRRTGLSGWIPSLLGRIGSSLKRDPLGIAILLFLASATASTLASPNPAQSLHGAPDSTAGLVAAVSTAVVYFASRAASGGQTAALVRFARAAGFAGAIAVLYSFIQLAGLDPLVWGRTATFGGNVRVFGTLGHPNMLGAYLLMTVPLAAWLATRSRSGIERAMWSLLVTASLIVIATTLSRGAWIGLVAAVLAWLLLGARARGGRSASPRPLHRTRRIPGTVTLSVVALAAAAVLMARSPMGGTLATRVRQIASLNAPTTQSRLHIWRAGWRMARDHPALGVGLDAFGVAFPRYRTSAYWRIEWGKTPNKAHNEPLQILATQGVSGGIAALLVVVLAGLSIWRATRAPDPAVRMGAAAAGASLVGFAVQNLANFTVVALGTLTAALLGWLSTAVATSVPERREAGSRGRHATAPAWTYLAAAFPVAYLFAQLVVLPIRAQIYEKEAISAPIGSPARAFALKRAAALAPWDSRYEDRLGVSLLEQAGRDPDPGRRPGTLREARGAERRAIRIEPENGYYYCNLGRVQAAQTQLRPPEATVRDVRISFAQALERDSVNAQIMDLASNALFTSGDAATARAIALRSAALYPDLAQPLAFLGYEGLIEQRWRDAADTLEVAVRREWWDEKVAKATTWSNLSAAYLALDRNEDAMHAAEEALLIQPDNRDAQGNRELARERLAGAPPVSRGTQ